MLPKEYKIMKLLITYFFPFPCHFSLLGPNTLLQAKLWMMEKLVEWLAGETEVLGENLPQCRFVQYKLHMQPGREPGPPRWEASD
jgi:hypothetical protein